MNQHYVNEIVPETKKYQSQKGEQKLWQEYLW